MPTKSIKKTKVRPLGDKVLVSIKKDGEQEKTKGGIIIPETINQERSAEGVVVAVGEGKRLDDGKIVTVSVKVGQKVIFSKYGHEEVEIGGEEFLIISESNILAVIE